MQAQNLRPEFTKPDAPRSHWEAFKWFFLEPSLLEQYSARLSRKEAWKQFLAIYLKYVVPLMVLLWLITLTVLASWNPSSFLFRVINEYVRESAHGFVERWHLLLTNVDIAKGLAGSLAVGLVVGLVFCLAGGLAFGLAVALAVASAVVFGPNMVIGSESGLVFSFVGGLAFGVVGGLAIGLAGGFAATFGVGLAVGLGAGYLKGLWQGFLASISEDFVVGFYVSEAVSKMAGLEFGMAFGMAAGLGYFVGHFRVLFYPLHLTSLFRTCRLTSNPYLRDEGIFLPLPWVDRRLLQEAREDPELGIEFARFLFRHRRLQHPLACKLEHAAMASRWLSLT
ncbi:MAG: hypothetical protein D6706_08735, partial [Chloroflexi bacterium]